MRSLTGFTLTELVIALAVFSILILAGFPSLNNFLLIQKGRQAIASLELHIRSAREQAIHLGTTVVICPSKNNVVCTNDWNNPIIIFADINRNSSVDDNEPILQRIREARDQEVRQLTGNFIRFSANGFAGINTGSLSYCSDKTATINEVLIISRVGRIRRGMDKNGDGIKELANHSSYASASIMQKNNGLYLALDHGEKVLSSTLTVNNVVYASTFRPSLTNNNGCDPDAGKTRMRTIAPAQSPTASEREVNMIELKQTGIPAQPVLLFPPSDPNNPDGQVKPVIAIGMETQPLVLSFYDFERVYWREREQY